MLSFSSRSYTFSLSFTQVNNAFFMFGQAGGALTPHAAVLIVYRVVMKRFLVLACVLASFSFGSAAMVKSTEHFVNKTEGVLGGSVLYGVFTGTVAQYGGPNLNVIFTFMGLNRVGTIALYNDNYKFYCIATVLVGSTVGANGVVNGNYTVLYDLSTGPYVCLPKCDWSYYTTVPSAPVSFDACGGQVYGKLNAVIVYIHLLRAPGGLQCSPRPLVMLTGCEYAVRVVDHS